MDNIIEPNEFFDFSQISLAQPVGIQGGAYFTKILLNDKSLYIQTPKSLTRQGFIKNGKKIHTDLMFNNNNDSFIHWIEKLEEKCQELIFKKSESWFQNSLEKNDIESAFNSSLKIYKSGKFYLLRTNVKMNSITNLPIIKIFNENETIMNIDDVNSETNIISIIEIQGIKFTTRNFQIEMELKQVMVLNTDLIFESCVIKKNKNNLKNNNDDSDNNISNSNINFIEDNLYSNFKNNNLETITNNILEEIDRNKLYDKHDTIIEELDLDSFNNYEEKDKEEEYKKKEEKEEMTDKCELEDVNITLEIEDLENENNKDLKEINELTVDNNLETIKLKKPNEVYYEIYKEARRKAKDAKQAAIIAYLEAKNIKKTYMLEDIETSDDSNMDDLSDYDYESESENENEIENEL